METYTDTTAQIFCTTYNIYNNGLQFAKAKNGQEGGFWVELDSHADAEDFLLCVEAALTQSEIAFGIFNGSDVELMFTDYEGFPSSLYGESMCESDLEKIYNFVEMKDAEKETLCAVMEHMYPNYEDALQQVENGAYLYEVDSTFFMSAAEQYAYDIVHETEGVPESVSSYFDYKSYFRDLDGAIEVDRDTVLVTAY